MPKDYYAVLGIDRDATDEEIKSVYRDAVKTNHPDMTGNDPEKSALFQEITEAYKTLSDPYRRKLHDQELPMKSYPLRRPTPEKVWKEVTDVILLRSDRVGQFHVAMQTAKPLALEEDQVIVGFGDEDYRQAAYLDVAADRRHLLNALELVMGREFGYRYIQGTRQADWERVKSAEERVAARAKATRSLMGSREKPDAVWDELLARMTRSYNQVTRRQYPQNRATFLMQAIGWIDEAVLRAQDDGMAEEAVDRALSRAIERLANLVDLPPTAVAIEIVKRRC